MNNVDTQPHIALSAAQQAAITQAMRQFAGRKAMIYAADATREAIDFGSKLQAALHEAGINAEFHTANVMSEGTEVPPWLFMGWGEHNADMGSALLLVIRNAEVVPVAHAGYHYYPEGEKDGFQIVVSQPSK